MKFKCTTLVDMKWPDWEWGGSNLHSGKTDHFFV